MNLIFRCSTNKLLILLSNQRSLALLKQKQRSQELTGEEEEQLKKLNAQLEVASGGIAAFLDRAEREFATPDDKDRIGEVVGVQELQKILIQLDRETGQKTAAVYTLVGETSFDALIISADALVSVSSPPRNRRKQ